jgi:hypothetical protein
MLKWILVTVVGVCCAGVAPASILPTFVSLSTLSPGVYAYEYDLVVQAPDQRIQAHTSDGYDNEITFYDFAGATGATTCTGANCGSFSSSMQNYGPSLFGAAMEGALPNITFLYSGDSTLAPGTALGRFGIISTEGNGGGAVVVGSQGTVNAPGTAADGLLATSASWVAGPAGGTLQTSATPEAWSIVLLGSGLLALGAFKSKLNRRR